MASEFSKPGALHSLPHLAALSCRYTSTGVDERSVTDDETEHEGGKLASYGDGFCLTASR